MRCRGYARSGSPPPPHAPTVAAPRSLARTGNFIDTANKYQEGKSEEMLGQFMKDTNSRDDLVLATKYSLKTNPRAGPNYTGNSRKNFFESLKASLRRLQTDYVGTGVACGRGLPVVTPLRKTRSVLPALLGLLHPHRRGASEQRW